MKLCVFTSTRADYGIYLPLLRELKRNDKIELRLFVTGTHLDETHGYTYAEIEKTGFQAHYKVSLDMNEQNDSHMPTFAKAVQQFSEALRTDLPDAAVVLGDRYETLAFAIVANSFGVPLCHLHGGEVTEGALDDGYRHCITKLSNFHFTVSEKCKARVIAMGENPSRVFNFGSLAMDNVKSLALLDSEALVNEFGDVLKKSYVLVTYHPETMSPGVDRVQLPALLQNLEKLIAAKDLGVVMTRSNADQGNSWIHEQMQKFAEKYPKHVLYVASVGNIKFLSLLRNAEVLAGNSSSGIFEAPALGTPTLNIGDRQKGRERAASVIDIDLNKERMLEAVNLGFERALQMKGEIKDRNLSIFGDGRAAEQMVKVMNSTNFSRYMKKDFYEKLA